MKSTAFPVFRMEFSILGEFCGHLFILLIQEDVITLLQEFFPKNQMTTEFFQNSEQNSSNWRIRLHFRSSNRNSWKTLLSSVSATGKINSSREIIRILQKLLSKKFSSSESFRNITRNSSRKSSRLCHQKWYFVTKIVLTYLQKFWDH